MKKLFTYTSFLSILVLFNSCYYPERTTQDSRKISKTIEGNWKITELTITGRVNNSGPMKTITNSNIGTLDIRSNSFSSYQHKYNFIYSEAKNLNLPTMNLPLSYDNLICVAEVGINSYTNGYEVSGYSNPFEMRMNNISSPKSGELYVELGSNIGRGYMKLTKN